MSRPQKRNGVASINTVWTGVASTCVCGLTLPVCTIFLKNVMGMELIGSGLSYNWGGWRQLVAKLDCWGVDISAFRFMNDMEPLSAKTFEAVADAIEAHLEDLSPDQREWLEPHIDNWRHCGGCVMG